MSISMPRFTAPKMPTAAALQPSAAPPTKSILAPTRSGRVDYSELIAKQKAEQAGDDAAEQLRYSLGLQRGANVNTVAKALRDYGLPPDAPAMWWQVECREDLECFRTKVEHRIEGLRPVGPTLIACAAAGFVGALALSWLKAR